MNVWGLVFVAAGAFTVAGGAMDWEWFMNHHKARFICSVLGRNGARVFYVLFGMAFVVLGVLLGMGIIQNGPKN
jgi:hypothetical protein